MTTATSATIDDEAVLETSLRIHIRFITNRCVAARVDAREQAEWPPHPGRFYMALAAAYFETDGTADDKKAERQALDWLASQSSPRIHAVPVEERTPVTCYVPVNDVPQPNKAMLQSAPGMPRSRQSRAFPTVIPQRSNDIDEAGPDVTYEWLNPAGLADHLPALERLCRQVIRVGHSSSLVIAWGEAGTATFSDGYWEPTGSSIELTCRMAVSGELDRLQTACQADRIDLFAQLKNEIDSTQGAAQKAAKKRFTDAFGEAYKASLKAPEPTPATLGVWQGYRRVELGENVNRSIHENSYFERDMLILAKRDGPTLNVERTLGLTQALRLALIKVHGQTAMPAWLSGHDPNGSPTSSPHAAFLALPFAGYPHADGHIMGLALALPKGVSVLERGRWLGPLLVRQDTGHAAQPPLKLWAENLADWTVQLEERASPPLMLQNATWTKPSTTWASVTPVVLDKFPKASRYDERRAWFAEVVAIMKLACTRSGLPEPIEVDIDTTAWQTGVPRAWAKARRLHGNSDRTAPLGDGFPLLAKNPSRTAKPQVHVWLRFERPVAGPVLIGAGRFAGYGLCLPHPVC